MRTWGPLRWEAQGALARGAAPCPLAPALSEEEQPQVGSWSPLSRQRVLLATLPPVWDSGIRLVMLPSASQGV